MSAILRCILQIAVLLAFISCSRRPPIDPRSVLTPQEIYLLFALEYEDTMTPRWQDLRSELDHLESMGLLEQFFETGEGAAPRSKRLMLTVRGDMVAQRLGWVADFHEHPNLRPDQPLQPGLSMPMAEDLPELPGEKYFVTLTMSAGTELGKNLARTEFNRGCYRLLVYGLPNSNMTAGSEIFLLKHRVFVYSIAKTLITEGVVGVAKGYNLVMSGLLHEKFGTNLFDEALRAARPKAADYTWLTSREMYLLLDLAHGNNGASQWYEFVPELQILEASKLIRRNYDEEAVNHYHFASASLTSRGDHVARLLGWGQYSYDR